MANDPTEDPACPWAKCLSTGLIGLSASAGNRFGSFMADVMADVADVAADYIFYDKKRHLELRKWHNERVRKRQNEREMKMEREREWEKKISAAWKLVQETDDLYFNKDRQRKDPNLDAWLNYIRVKEDSKRGEGEEVAI